ncbi:DsbA family protein [Lysinibacillus sphaericus]|uniref:DsbA family protein n=1 Tax=Lysinibacillus sphaericus TaxID=1421 RepID=UPI001E34F215|nr:thioredoxin domain-containing protein [Lysinibacillus sphaericus]
MSKSSGLKKIFFLSIIIFVFISTLVILTNRNSETTDKTTISKSSEFEGQPTLGEPDAPVTIIEFGDFKCPACKVWGEAILPQLENDYINSGKVKFSYINVLFHGEESITGALAAESVFKQDPDSYWDFHKAVFETQPKESPGDVWLTQEKMLEIAKDYPSVDQEQLKRDMGEELTKPQVDVDEKLYTKHEVNQTPTIKINGVTIKNPFNYEKIKEMINQELEGDHNE